ncbi:hypothetical protein [Xenorhabdus siamensis]|uniref:hypothetical protein n=1 Tax=Xenorhabdus siamensis TaxID=3136254 RepID=UPI0030F485E6
MAKINVMTVRWIKSRNHNIIRFVFKSKDRVVWDIPNGFQIASHQCGYVLLTDFKDGFVAVIISAGYATLIELKTSMDLE